MRSRGSFPEVRYLGTVRLHPPAPVPALLARSPELVTKIRQAQHLWHQEEIWVPSIPSWTVRVHYIRFPYPAYPTAR